MTCCAFLLTGAALRHRQVKIHTIAIGGNLEILEWLALDSKGDHVKIR